MRTLKKALAVLLVTSLFAYNISWAYPVEDYAHEHKLAAQSNLQAEMMNPASEAFRTKVLGDVTLLGTVLTIGEYLLGNPGQAKDGLPLRHLETFLASALPAADRTQVGIASSQVAVSEGVVSIPYTKSIAQVGDRLSALQKELARTEETVSHLDAEWTALKKPDQTHTMHRMRVEPTNANQRRVFTALGEARMRVARLEQQIGRLKEEGAANYTIQIALKGSPQAAKLEGKEWEGVSDVYTVTVKPESVVTASHSLPETSAGAAVLGEAGAADGQATKKDGGSPGAGTGRAGDDTHTFISSYGTKGALVSFLLAVISGVVAGLLYADQQHITGGVITAAVVGVYFFAAMVKFFMVSGQVHAALVIKGIDSRDARETAIARYSGYRHEAYYALPGWLKLVIDTHESFEHEWAGMLAMLPIINLLLLSRVTRARQRIQLFKATGQEADSGPYNPQTSYVSQAVDRAVSAESVEERVTRLEYLHYNLRLLPLMIDVWKETGKDDRLLEVLANVTGKDKTADAAALRELPKEVKPAEWRHIYRAMGYAFLETGDVWRAITCFNAVLQNGGYDVQEADIAKGDMTPEAAIELLADLYTRGDSRTGLDSDYKDSVFFKAALMDASELRANWPDDREGDEYRNLARVVAYHHIMTRDAQYTAAASVVAGSPSEKKGVQSFGEVYGVAVETSAKILNELSDILNETPEESGRMRPFAGAEIMDNPHEITYTLERSPDGKVKCTDAVVYDTTRDTQVGEESISEHIEVREADIVRRFDIMEHGQWFSYRTYDLRSAFRTTDLELPGVTERYPALMSKKLIFRSAIELGTTMLEGLGLKDKDLKEEIEANPELAAELRAKVYGLVSGGCRLPIQEHRDIFALGLLYSGVNVFLVKGNEEGYNRVLAVDTGFVAQDIARGALQPEDVERFSELAPLFEEKGIVSTPMYYMIVNLLWNDGIRVGEGRHDLRKAYEQAAHLLFGGGHGTASHNPWEFSGWKQMLSWFRIVEDKAGAEHTIPQVLSINDAEMQGLKEGIIAGRTRPGLPQDLKDRKLQTLSAVEVAYFHYLYSTAYIRLGRDVWSWLWSRALEEQGGIRKLIMATREFNWDNEDWGALRGEIGTSLGFGNGEQQAFDTAFPERPLLCWQRPFKGLPKLGLGYQHGSGGLDQIIFRALGQEVVVVHDDPDYMFSDGEPYPNIPWFVRRAMGIFEKEGVEISVVGDEDKDRLICWLPQVGKMVQGDELMGLRARTIARLERERAQALGLQETRRTTFLGEVKFYRGFTLLIEKLKRRLAALGITLHMDGHEGPVGFGYVKDEMKQFDGGVAAQDEETLLFGSRESNILLNLRNGARLGGGAEVSGHGMEPLSGAEMSAVEIADKILTPMVMGDRTFNSFTDAYNDLPKSFASPEVRVGTHHQFGRYEKNEVVVRVLKQFIQDIEAVGFTKTGTRRQYNEDGVEYGSLYHIYEPPSPKDMVMGGMTLHGVTEIGIDLIDGAKYFIKCKEGEYFTFFLNRKSNTQNEIITRVDGDTIDVRNAVAAHMYGMYERVDASDLLSEEAKAAGEPAIMLSRDLWIVYEVLPRLAAQKLSADTQAHLHDLAGKLTGEVLTALAQGKLRDGMQVENRDSLGYFYSFEGEREEGFERIAHLTEKMLGSEHPLLLPEEQDLGEMVDTFLGYRLPGYVGQAIRKEYREGIQDQVAGYNTAVNYDYVTDESSAVKGELGLELLAARYVTRIVKDNLMKMDVSHMRMEEDYGSLQRGDTVLINGQHFFWIREARQPGTYEARFSKWGGETTLPLEKDQKVVIRLFSAEEGSKLKAGDTVESLPGERVVTFDKHGVMNARELGVLVTTETGAAEPAPAALSIRTRMAEMANTVLTFLRQATELGSIIDARPVGRDDVSAEIAERARSAAEAVQKLQDAPNTTDKDKLAEIGQVAHEMAKNLDDLEADGIVGTILAMAKAAKAEDQNLIIGIETKWIPGYDKMTMQHSAINPLILEIDSLQENLRKMGLDNVRVIHDSGRSLGLALAREAKQTSTQLSNVVVLASEKTIGLKAFDPLRSTKAETRAFLAGVNPQELVQFYRHWGETTDQQLYISIMEMLSITLELASGKEAPELPIIMSYDKDTRTLIFIPRAEPMDYEQLQQRYQRERQALIAA